MELDSDNASGREQPQEGGDGGAGDLSDASASASSSKYERHYSTGSIYNYIPVPPSAFAPHVTDVKMHDRVANLADQLNRGSTRLIVERALADLVSKDRLKRQYRIQTRRRKSKIKVSDGDDEGVVPSRAGSGSKIGSRDQMKRCYARRPLPEIQIPDVDIPHNFPSSSLLTSIHHHASTLFTESHQLLPPLTREEPCLPDSIVHHFDSILEKLNQKDIELFKVPENHARSAAGRTSKIIRWKEDSWGIKFHADGLRKDCWTDVDRKFNGSALVAVGMFAHLLAKHAAGGSLVNVAAAIDQQRAEQEPTVDGENGIAPGLDNAGLEEELRRRKRTFDTVVKRRERVVANEPEPEHEDQDHEENEDDHEQQEDAEEEEEEEEEEEDVHPASIASGSAANRNEGVRARSEEESEQEGRVRKRGRFVGESDADDSE